VTLATKSRVPPPPAGDDGPPRVGPPAGDSPSAAQAAVRWGFIVAILSYARRPWCRYHTRGLTTGRIRHRRNWPDGIQDRLSESPGHAHSGFASAVRREIGSDGHPTKPDLPAPRTTGPGRQGGAMSVIIRTRAAWEAGGCSNLDDPARLPRLGHGAMRDAPGVASRQIRRNGVGRGRPKTELGGAAWPGGACRRI